MNMNTDFKRALVFLVYILYILVTRSRIQANPDYVLHGSLSSITFSQTDLFGTLIIAQQDMAANDMTVTLLRKA